MTIALGAGLVVVAEVSDGLSSRGDLAVKGQVLLAASGAAFGFARLELTGIRESRPHACAKN